MCDDPELDEWFVNWLYNNQETSQPVVHRQSQQQPEKPQPEQQKQPPLPQPLPHQTMPFIGEVNYCNASGINVTADVHGDQCSSQSLTMFRSVPTLPPLPSPQQQQHSAQRASASTATSFTFSNCAFSSTASFYQTPPHYRSSPPMVTTTSAAAAVSTAFADNSEANRTLLAPTAASFNTFYPQKQQQNEQAKKKATNNNNNNQKPKRQVKQQTQVKRQRISQKDRLKVAQMVCSVCNRSNVEYQMRCKKCEKANHKKDNNKITGSGAVVEDFDCAMQICKADRSWTASMCAYNEKRYKKIGINNHNNKNHSHSAELNACVGWDSERGVKRWKCRWLNIFSAFNARLQRGHTPFVFTETDRQTKETNTFQICYNPERTAIAVSVFLHSENKLVLANEVAVPLGELIGGGNLPRQQQIKSYTETINEGEIFPSKALWDRFLALLDNLINVTGINGRPEEHVLKFFLAHKQAPPFKCLVQPLQGTNRYTLATEECACGMRNSPDNPNMQWNHALHVVSNMLLGHMKLLPVVPEGEHHKPPHFCPLGRPISVEAFRQLYIDTGLLSGTMISEEIHQNSSAYGFWIRCRNFLDLIKGYIFRTVLLDFFNIGRGIRPSGGTLDSDEAFGLLTHLLHGTMIAIGGGGGVAEIHSTVPYVSSPREECCLNRLSKIATQKTGVELPIIQQACYSNDLGWPPVSIGDYVDNFVRELLSGTEVNFLLVDKHFVKPRHLYIQVGMRNPPENFYVPFPNTAAAWKGVIDKAMCIYIGTPGQPMYSIAPYARYTIVAYLLPLHWVDELDHQLPGTSSMQPSSAASTSSNEATSTAVVAADNVVFGTHMSKQGWYIVKMRREHNKRRWRNMRLFFKPNDEERLQKEENEEYLINILSKGIESIATNSHNEVVDEFLEENK